MRTYISEMDYPPSRVFMCPDCGSMTVDPALHDAWHAELLEEQIQTHEILRGDR